MTIPQDWASDGQRDGVGGPSSTLVAVTDVSQVGEARRAAVALGLAAGLDETERGSLAIVVTEMATNLARHATQGVLMLRPLDAFAGNGQPGVEALALDRGPGIANVARAMTDGFSTGGTSGAGLGAIRRMASEFDLFSTSPGGSAVLARVTASRPRGEEPPERPAPFDLGVVCTPLGGSGPCGDGWLVLDGERHVALVVVDGLGHGLDAARAADAALRVARAAPELAPAALVQRMHLALRATRGAAVAVAHVPRQAGEVRFAGVGNVAAAAVTPAGTRSMASHNGTVGHMLHKVQEFTYPWTADACLVMHSDGLGSRWRLDAYPGLVHRSPALIAGVLYRDFARGRDDATVLVARPRRLTSPATSSSA
jgi:anti-sigma regulatory factor (Ser/Thr protein kinase)